MDINNLFATCATIVALVSAGGLGLQRSRVSALRQDVIDEKGRSDALRKDVADLQARLAEKDRQDAEKDVKIAKLESDLEYAQRIATGEVHWNATNERLEHLEQQATQHHRETTSTLERVEKKVDDLGDPR